jgi:hypothetical protein
MKESSAGGIDRRIDYEAIPSLEAALCKAVGKPDSDFHAQRVPGIEINPKTAWLRVVSRPVV